MAEFKDRLKELRKEKGITQQQLADLMGKTESLIRKYENGTTFPASDSLSRVSIGNYERGDREPVYSTIVGLANFFDVTTDYLLGLSDIRKFEFNLSIIPMNDLLSEINRRCGELTERTKTKIK